jgi:hypothetical protein
MSGGLKLQQGGVYLGLSEYKIGLLILPKVPPLGQCLGLYRFEIADALEKFRLHYISSH